MRLMELYVFHSRQDSNTATTTSTDQISTQGPHFLFPKETVPPAAGSVIGPVVTEFGSHIILVPQREENKDQVEEKLARIDPDARKAL